jgi:hypothetical protein
MINAEAEISCQIDISDAKGAMKDIGMAKVRKLATPFNQDELCRLKLILNRLGLKMIT